MKSGKRTKADQDAFFDYISTIPELTGFPGIIGGSQPEIPAPIVQMKPPNEFLKDLADFLLTQMENEVCNT